MDHSARLAKKLAPLEQSLIEPGEQLAGSCVATQSSMFSGGVRVVVTTDRRVIVQPVNRKFEPAGEALTIAPGGIDSLDVDGLGGGWYNTAISLLEREGFEIKLRTTSGEKVKLSMLSGEGRMLGSLGGGEKQRGGVSALLEWLHANA